MHRHVIILLIFVLGTTALVSAQENQPQGDSDAAPITIERGSLSPPLFAPLSGVWSAVEVEAERVAAPLTTQQIAADFCSEAPSLGLSTFGTAGDISTVNDMTNSPDDPALACMWGNPQSPRGFRTVWYKFQAPVSGYLTVSTGFDPSNFQDSYDTVVALYQSGDGTCDTLAQLACDDDSQGFLSELSQFVIEGRTYYIEVADSQFSVQGAATLRLAVVLEEGESFWQRLSEPWNEPRSRHMVVSDGRFFYVIAGESEVDPYAVSEELTRRFDPRTGVWTELWPMPRPAYSRTSAAYFNGRIYIPSGYVGGNQYAGTHWIYEIESNRWVRGPSVPWAAQSPSGQPYAWHQAVATPEGYYVTGGLLSGDPDPTYPSDAQPTGNLLLFRPDATGTGGTWVGGRPSMSRPRYAHVADALQTPQGRRVCVAGGLSKDANDPGLAVVLSSAECYSPASATWAPIASLNFPRFSAGSAVGPDGRWYVFGGVNNRLQTVPHTEVYNPATNSWQVLDSRFSLRRPGLAWPRGDFVEDTLWVFGGETLPGNEVVPLVQRLLLPSRGTWLPFMATAEDRAVEPNDTFATAHPLGLNQPVTDNFAGSDDFFDFYTFHVTDMVPYQVEVTDIPPESDYDVFIYSFDKIIVGDSQNIGSMDERATTFPLTPGTYYALVLRTFGQPTTDQYRIQVTR